MPNFEDRLIRLMEELHPLDRVPRAGYLLRGVTEPETVAAHSFSLALLTLLFAERHADRFNADKAVAMALVHDTAEARMMDIPRIACTPELQAAKGAAERAIVESFFAGVSDRLIDCHRELEEGRSPEARLVKALDKAQMLIKVLRYEAEGRGRLGDFWDNPASFDDYGLPEVAALFRAIRARAGRAPTDA